MGQTISLHITNPLFKFKLPLYNKKYEGSYAKFKLYEEFPIYYIPTTSQGYDLTKTQELMLRATRNHIYIKDNNIFVDISNTKESIYVDNTEFKVSATKNKNIIKSHHKYNLNFE